MSALRQRLERYIEAEVERRLEALLAELEQPTAAPAPKTASTPRPAPKVARAKATKQAAKPGEIDELVRQVVAILEIDPRESMGARRIRNALDEMSEHRWLTVVKGLEADGRVLITGDGPTRRYQRAGGAS